MSFQARVPGRPTAPHVTDIALYGTFAEKKKYAWWSSPGRVPVKQLHLNIVEDPADEELGLRGNRA